MGEQSSRFRESVLHRYTLNFILLNVREKEGGVVGGIKFDNFYLILKIFQFLNLLHELFTFFDFYFTF